MKMLIRAALLLSALCASPVAAASTLPQVQNAGGANVPSQAALQIDASGNAILGPAPTGPLAGSASTSGSFGPFTPQLGRSIWLTLSGTWTGTVTVVRTTDGVCADGLPLTAGGVSYAAYTGNANEAVMQESATGAAYCLSISVSSGAVSYRLAQ